MRSNAIIKKLQKALLQKRIIIKIGTSQFYSNEQGRLITMYSVKTPIMEHGKKGWKDTDLEIIRTASQIDVALTLKEIMEQMAGWE